MVVSMNDLGLDSASYKGADGSLDVDPDPTHGRTQERTRTVLSELRWEPRVDTFPRLAELLEGFRQKNL